MTAQRRAVLLTRPAEAMAETAARLHALGYDAVTAPLLQSCAIKAALPPADSVQAVLITSPRALAAVGPDYYDVPLLAVGDATAAAASARGHRHVVSAAGDATDLQRLVARHCTQDGGALLLLSGAGEGAALASGLAARFCVEQRFVYAVTPVPALPASACQALLAAPPRLRAAVFFSAKTASVFVTLAEAAGLRDTVIRVEALAISAATATALAPLPWRSVRVASRPNQDELLALLQ
jgi:uroporphyrinogen-III synthase